MAKTDVWMPLYIGDYLADTARLTTEQHGAYLLLIMDYWRNGPPPDDENVLANVCKFPLKRWRENCSVIGGFFSVVEGVWRHGRADEELAKALSNKAAKTKSGANGADRKWGPDRDSQSKLKRSERLANARHLARHSLVEWQVLLSVCGPYCLSCGVEGELVKDHITPIYQGGSDGIGNIQPLCRSCNAAKGPDSTDHRPDNWESSLAERLANACLTPGPSPSPSPIGKPIQAYACKASPEKPAIPNCPFEEIISTYHAELPELPQYRVRTEKRDGVMRQRWRQFYASGDFKTSEEGIECFRWYFKEKVKPSKFLTGRINGKDRPFLADLEWLMLPSNFAKVLEGKYS